MFKKYPLALYLTWLIILFIVPLPLVFLLNTGLLDSPSNLLTYDAGVAAYTWWLTIIFLSTRPQWLDRLIGIPSMYFIHGMIGVLALGLASFHVLNAFSMGTLIKNLGNTAWYLSIFSVLYAAFFLSGWLVDHFSLAAKTKQKLQFIFKHQISIWIHRINFIVIGLIWLHVHVIVRINRISSFMILFDLYTIVSLSLYGWKKFVASAADSINGQVISNISVNSHVYQLKIKLNPHAKKYRAGDFYFLSFRNVLGISSEPHPFSVTYSPTNTPNLVTFTIQSHGDFTSKLGAIPIGSDVKLEGPFGRFSSIIEAASIEQPLVFIGMGTGIAPLLSLTQQYFKTHKIHVLWSAHNSTDFYYQQEFNKLVPKITYEQHLRRFTKTDYQNKLTEKEFSSGLFFIVGPAPGIIATEKALHQLDVKRAQLIDERLTM
ncbi:iron reductase [Xylocopilactobacillus apis]|uniref:FAD-binding FR-type domain-containing protein n=1 Tax=Xylocopilactobacillus apis TaxID=2932183 RepID=A0AAU9CTM3_9LACO|nr:iron reductase [Xylocopilactobacillus apis]BDR57322.1 hypothetical protein KIMC2_18840 [Xylocopilactobacillus apis]